MLDALKKYGMIVADNGSNWFVTGAADTRWDDDDLNQLKTVPGSAFEVVEHRRGASTARPPLVASSAVPFSTRPVPDPTGPGQESAWEYPRPPRLEPVTARLVVVLGGETIADTTRAYRVLETSHPPNYYFPPGDVRAGALEPAQGRRRSASGRAGRTTSPCAAVTGGRGRGRVGVRHAERRVRAASPGHVAFYAGRMDACYVDDELVVAQPGGFYGGWITRSVVGPFKGGPGSRGW